MRAGISALAKASYESVARSGRLPLEGPILAKAGLEKPSSSSCVATDADVIPAATSVRVWHPSSNIDCIIDRISLSLQEVRSPLNEPSNPSPRVPSRGFSFTITPSLIAPSPIIPTSTYRVQLNAGFTFADARAIVPYLHDLGIGALYTSPFLRATPGSTHGYDVTDYGSSTRDRHRRGSARSHRGAARARHGRARRRGAEPHGDRRRRQRLVAGRARERAHLRPTPSTSTSTGGR